MPTPNGNNVLGIKEIFKRILTALGLGAAAGAGALLTVTISSEVSDFMRELVKINSGNTTTTNQGTDGGIFIGGDFNEGDYNRSDEYNMNSPQTGDRFYINENSQTDFLDERSQFDIDLNSYSKILPGQTSDSIPKIDIPSSRPESEYTFPNLSRTAPLEPVTPFRPEVSIQDETKFEQMEFEQNSFVNNLTFQIDLEGFAGDGKQMKDPASETAPESPPSTIDLSPVGIPPQVDDPHDSSIPDAQRVPNRSISFGGSAILGFGLVFLRRPNKS